MEANKLAPAGAARRAEADINERETRLRWRDQVSEYSLVLIFVVMFLTMSFSVDHFFSVDNMPVIAYLRINPLITTLATMEIVRGLGFIVSHGQAVGVSSEGFIALGSLSLFGIALPIWVTLKIGRAHVL